EALLLHHAPPRGRGEGYLRSVGLPDLGHKPARLRGGGTVRQPHPRDTSVRYAPLVTPRLPLQRIGPQAKLPWRAEQGGLVAINRVVDGFAWRLAGGHAFPRSGSGDSRSTRRNCGNAHIPTSITMIAPAPPINADGTAPSPAAPR